MGGQRPHRRPCLPNPATISLGSQLLLMAVRHRHIHLATGLFDVAHQWLDLTQSSAFGGLGGVFTLQVGPRY